jgi:hypothetical protein
MSKKLFTLVLLALFLTAGYTLAQQTSLPQGRLTGKVIDDQGNALPGVSVEATGPTLVGKAATVTDENGVYRLFSLPSGTYRVMFVLHGFKTLIRQDIIVQLSQTITMNVTLEQSAIEEQVTVIGMSPLIDVKSTVKGMTMTKEVFMSLPRSRNFDGLLSTVPGVQYDNVGGGLLVDGATGTENMWYMDGADITQPHIGTRAQSAVMELVEEVKVTASGYNAEFGGSMGGVVNVITRSGGNTFHGDIIGYFENNSQLFEGKSRDFGRWNPYDDELWEYVNNDDLYYNGGKDRDPYKRYEGVFNLGGYIWKDRIWFFGSFNPQYSDQGAMRGFDPNNPEVRNQEFHQKNNYWNGQLKLTASPLAGMRISASFVDNFRKYRGAIPSINGTSSSTYEWDKEGYDYPNWSAAALLDYSISNSLLMSLRGGYHMSNTTNQQIANRFTTWYFNYSNYIYEDDPFFQAHPDLLGYAGNANYGGAFTVTERYKLEKYSGNFDLTYYVNLGGEHAWKAGVQWLRDAEDVFNGAVSPHVNLHWGRGYYGLATGEPVMGTYGHYEIRSGWTSPYGSSWVIHRDSWAIYLQDSWTINSKLTINAGVRTEAEYIPAFTADTQLEGYQDKPINFGFGDKFAPRVGLVYDVFGDSSLKVFGSFGIYYDVMKLYMAEGAYGGFKWKTDYYELNNPDFTVIAASGDLDDRASQEAGGRYVGTMNWRIPSWDSTDPGMKPVSQREFSLGAEKKLMENLSVSLRIVNKHLLRTIEDIGVLTPAGEKYYNANPGFGWSLPISQGGKFADFTDAGNQYWPTPKATREYWGMNLSLEKRFSNNWQGGINYTLSRVHGNYGGLSSPDEANRNSPNVERYFDLWFMAYDINGNILDGPLPQDRTHYIKAYGSYAFPFGLTVGIVAYSRSGMPLTTELLTNNVQGYYPNARGDLGRMPWTTWANLYTEYTLRLGGRASVAVNLQIDNITNTKTWQSYQDRPNRIYMPISDDQFLTFTSNWEARVDDYWRDVSFEKPAGQFGTWGARVGARFSF